MGNGDVYLGRDMYEKVSCRIFTVPDAIPGKMDEEFKKADIKQF